MQRLIPVLALLTSAGVACAAEPAYNAKSLFMGTDDQIVSVPSGPGAAATPSPARRTSQSAAASKRKDVAAASPGRLGASYFIRLKNKDGTTSDVLASRAFYSGERFQVGVRVNRPTYVYIWNEDSAGKVVQLYPRPGQVEQVDAQGVVYLPSSGSFEFDVEPGIEQVTVVLAMKPSKQADQLRARQPDLISDPSQAVASAGCGSPTAGANIGPITGSTDPAFAQKGIKSVSDGPFCGAPAYIAKGVKFTDDPAPPPGEQVASYVVKPVARADETLTLRLKLLHR